MGYAVLVLLEAGSEFVGWDLVLRIARLDSHRETLAYDSVLQRRIG